MNISFDKGAASIVFDAIRALIDDHACPFCHVRVYLPNFAGAIVYKGNIRLIDDKLPCLIEYTQSLKESTPHEN